MKSPNRPLDIIEGTVRKQYDKLASVYDLRWKSYINNTLSFLKTWAKISPQETILDIACGTGEFEKLLLMDHSRQQIVGVDISENMLTIAKTKCSTFPQVSFHNASTEALPFIDNSFDVIVCANSFHYFHDPLAALTEMKRVLKPEGKVIILDWCRDFLSCKILDIILKVLDSAHNQCYSQKEFHRFFEDACFEVRCSTKVRFGLVWGLMIATAIQKF